MRSEIVREYTYREEVLPIVLLGALLNLAGPHLNASLLGFHLVFLDMGGTLLAAMLLGPWWGAGVGVLSNAFNGLAFTAYFPFAVVNVAGALAWGYWYRAARADHEVFSPEGRGDLLRWARLYLKLVLIAVLVCAPLGVVVKASVYPLMDIPLHYNKPIYLDVMGQLVAAGVPLRADVLAVLLIDAWREVLDKGGAVAIGLAFALALGAIPRLVVPDPQRIPLRQRVCTDSDSILWFVVMHFAYLMMSRITMPEITLESASRAVLWMREPRVVALLYAPIVGGVLAFILLSHDSNTPLGAAIEAARRARSGLYHRFRLATVALGDSQGGAALLKLPSFKSIYGLGAMLVVWPYRAKLAGFGPLVPAAIILIAMLVIFALFFAESRAFKARLERAGRWFEAIARWRDLRSDARHANGVMQAFLEMHRGLLSAGGEVPRHAGDLLYLPLINVATSGVLAEARRGGLERLVVFATPNSRTLQRADLTTVRALLERAGLHDAMVICDAPGFADAEARDAFRAVTGFDLGVLNGEDLARTVARFARGEDVGYTVVEGRLAGSAQRLAEDGESHAWRPGEAPAHELAGRALPGLRDVIDHLPQASRVADLGAGRGRHTLYALLRGHSVIAIEQRHLTFTDLGTNVAHADGAAQRAVLVEGDYMAVESAALRRLDLIVITGVLQHARDHADLQRRLDRLHSLMHTPGGAIYVEMLYDMRFDGQPAKDRVTIEVAGFERMLVERFPADSWSIERTGGPAYSVLDFSKGGRSFFSQASFVEQVAAEYLITHTVTPEGSA